MQAQIATALLDHSPDARGPVFDPFVGSGTVVTAGMVLGRDVIGWDVNPLAILICRVKSGPFHLAAFSAASQRVLLRHDGPSSDRQRFTNWEHWFTEHVARALGGLRSAIAEEPYAPSRRFLWLCLAETVRLTSNARAGTVKLHRRPAAELTTRPDPGVVFARVTRRNLATLARLRDRLDAGALLSRGHYKGVVTLELGDCRRNAYVGPESAAIITSPPYGDNTSTVAYGQHAFLPLQWIDLEDVHRSADRSALVSTYEIDRRSLGGSKRIDEADEADLRAQSPALDSLLDQLSAAKRDRRSRVVAFVRDLNQALPPVVRGLEIGCFSSWTVGSRRVGGRRVPLAAILVEFARAHGLSHVATLQRDIPLSRKRMAAENSVGATMHREDVVILQRLAVSSGSVNSEVPGSAECSRPSQVA